MRKALFTLRIELDLGGSVCPEDSLWIPAFAGMTDKRKCRHSREGGNPWFSDNRNPVPHPTRQRE